MYYIIMILETLTRFVCVRGTYRRPSPTQAWCFCDNYYKDDIYVCNTHERVAPSSSGNVRFACRSDVRCARTATTNSCCCCLARWSARAAATSIARRPMTPDGGWHGAGLNNRLATTFLLSVR